MRIEIKVALLNAEGERFMGAGVLWLLQNIHVSKSISSAARDMDMSYAKAHRILKRLEDNLGARVVHRHSGGNDRGGAELTALGEALVAQYDALQQRIKACAEEEFSRTMAAWPHADLRAEAGVGPGATVSASAVGSIP